MLHVQLAKHVDCTIIHKHGTYSTNPMVRGMLQTTSIYQLMTSIKYMYTNEYILSLDVPRVYIQLIQSVVGMSVRDNKARFEELNYVPSLYKQLLLFYFTNCFYTLLTLNQVSISNILRRRDTLNQTIRVPISRETLSDATQSQKTISLKLHKLYLLFIKLHVSLCFPLYNEKSNYEFSLRMGQRHEINKKPLQSLRKCDGTKTFLFRQNKRERFTCSEYLNRCYNEVNTCEQCFLSSPCPWS